MLPEATEAIVQQMTHPGIADIDEIPKAVTLQNVACRPQVQNKICHLPLFSNATPQICKILIIYASEIEAPYSMERVL